MVCLESGTDIFGSPDFKHVGFERESLCCSVDLVYFASGERITNVGQHRQTAQTGDDLTQQFDPLASRIGGLARQAGYIAARPAEVGHEAGCNWIAAADEHDRYGRDGSHCRAPGDILPKNHGHLPANQIGRKCWEPIELILRPAEFDSDVMAVDEPRFLKAVAECRYSVNCVGSSCCLKESDHRHRRLLRARRERPRSRAAAKQKEFAPSYA